MSITKSKKIICVILTFMCVLPCVLLPVSAASESSEYPCYCDKCVKLFNKSLTDDCEFIFSGSNESLNGLYPVVVRGVRTNSYQIYFVDHYSISSVSDNQFQISLSYRYTYGFDYRLDGTPFVVELNSVFDSGSFKNHSNIIDNQTLVVYYLPQSDFVSDYVRHYYPYPYSHDGLSESIFIWLDSLYNFVVDHTLVLLIVFIGILGGIISIFKVRR